MEIKIELDLKSHQTPILFKKILTLQVLQIQRTYLKIRLKVLSKTKTISNRRSKLEFIIKNQTTLEEAHRVACTYNTHFGYWRSWNMSIAIVQTAP
jgi:hypothetical protein